MLVEAGLNLDKDISYQFSGGHDKSLQLLLNKDVDVIATFDGVEDRYAKDFPQAKTDIQKLARCLVSLDLLMWIKMLIKK